MSISEEQKVELHEMLDYLLLARAGLERIDPDKLSPGMQYSSAWSRPRMELMLNASRFLREVIGVKLHSSELVLCTSELTVEGQRDPESLASLANALRSFLPLFAPIVDGRERSEFVSNMIEDFMGIYWGDEPRFFSVLPRMQGSHIRPFRIANLRLKALNWEKYLAAAEVSPLARQTLISNAYRTSWDSIRKWKSAILDQFDLEPGPPARPDWVREDYEEDPDAIHDMIQRDGDAYWTEKLSAKAGKGL